MREEVGVKESFEKTLVVSRLEESRCTKSGRGRPRLRWENYVKRDLSAVGGELTTILRDAGSGDGSES